MQRLAGEEQARRTVEAEAAEATTLAKGLLRRHRPLHRHDHLCCRDKMLRDALFLLICGEIRLPVAPQAHKPRQRLVVRTHGIMRLPIRAHSAPDEALHLADRVQQKQAFHQLAGLGRIIRRLRALPAQDRRVHVKAVEHRPVLNRRPPAQGVGFAFTKFLGSRQRYLPIHVGEVDHDAVFVDEATPDFGVGLLSRGSDIGGVEKTR